MATSNAIICEPWKATGFPFPNPCIGNLTNRRFALPETHRHNRTRATSELLMCLLRQGAPFRLLDASSPAAPDLVSVEPSLTVTQPLRPLLFRLSAPAGRRDSFRVRAVAVSHTSTGRASIVAWHSTAEQSRESVRLREVRLRQCSHFAQSCDLGSPTRGRWGGLADRLFFSPCPINAFNRQSPSDLASC